MQKWEYLRVAFVLSSGMGTKTGYSFIPEKKVNLQWVFQKYPLTKSEPIADIGGILVYPKKDDERPLKWDIMDYLGEDGWEPFSVAETSSTAIFHFKRNKSE